MDLCKDIEIRKSELGADNQDTYNILNLKSPKLYKLACIQLRLKRLNRKLFKNFENSHNLNQENVSLL